MFDAPTLMMLMIFVPFAAALIIPFVGRMPNVREAVTFIASVTLIGIVALLIKDVGANGRPEVILFEFGPNLPIKFKLEPLGALFAGVASGLWLINSLFTVGYLRGNNEKNQTRFFTCVAIAIGAAMGMASAGNLLTLFIFYEVLTLSTYPLVTHKGDDKARKGGRIYLSILMVTSIGLLLPAIVATFVMTGTTEFVLGGILSGYVTPFTGSVLLFLFAFGIGKAALMPIHPWLPNAMVAPTPVSALLHAVAVVKAGVFTMLKVVLYVFGPDLVTELPASDIIVWIAAFSILMASVIALRKDNLKARLAYSTVSQLSYVTLGAMLAFPGALMAAALQIVMHAWGKITLFMCAGAIYTGAHRTDISQLDGLGRSMPWVFGAFLIGAFSIIGLPPMGGSWPKFFLMDGSVDAGKLALLGVLIASSILNVIYLVPVAIRGFMGRAKDPDDDAHVKTPLLVVLPPVITAAGACVLFFLAGNIIEFLRPIIPAS